MSDTKPDALPDQIPDDSIHEPKSPSPSPSEGLKQFAGLGLDELRNDIQIIILDMQLQLQDSYKSHNALEVATDKLTAHIEAVCNEVINHSLIHVGDIVQSDHLSIVADTVDKLKTAQRQKLAELLHSKPEGITYGGGSRG